jgi:hypothetical protein
MSYRMLMAFASCNSEPQSVESKERTHLKNVQE